MPPPPGFRNKTNSTPNNQEQTETMSSGPSVDHIKRHTVRFAKLDSVEKSKRKVEELKIAAGEEITAINVWGDKVEE